MLPKRFSLSICLLVFSCASSCATGRAPSPRPSEAPTSLLATSVRLGSPESQSVTPIPLAARATFTPHPTAPAVAGSGIDPEAIAPQTTQAPLDPKINPLTGQPAKDQALLERRPLVIKISNYPREIRPQYGLNEADVVFEYYIEWLDTRFIGIFYGNDASQIGPVRSGRYFDEHILRMYHAYYVFNYADPREYAYFLGGDLQKWLVVPGYGNCPPFFQDRVSKTITDVLHYETYFDSTRFSGCPSAENADNSRQALRGGFFNLVAPVEGAEVDRIFTHYSRCDYNYWKYDPATMRYLRYQEISPNQAPQHIDDCSDTPETYAPLVDALVDQQVTADNIVVIFVSHTFANEGEQQDEIYHINLVDSGKAFVFRDGLGLPARWMRTDIDQPLLITTEAGAPVYLRPGRTFFEVIGETSTAWSDGLDWHFDFQTP
jgi:hypothetical protein